MSGSRRPISVLLLLLAFAALSAPAPSGATTAWSAEPGSGPQVPSLDQVERLSSEGDVDGARAALTAWWDSRFDGAPPGDRQRGLWLRGKLTVDPGMARRDYLRLVVEHPGGPRAADALLRLAQMEHGAGRFAAAADFFERLLREYPGSPHRLEGRRWLDGNRERVARARAELRARRTAGAEPEPRAGVEADEPSPALGAEEPPGAEIADGGEPESVPGAASDVAPDVGGGTAEAGGDTTAEAEDASTVEAGGDAAAERGAGSVSVQLGAFSSEERALSFVGRAEGRGISGLRLVRVPGSDLVRVRVGRFPDRDAAAPLQDRIEALGFDVVVVTDADRERTIR